jgi:hypothetical protein
MRLSPEQVLKMQREGIDAALKATAPLFPGVPKVVRPLRVNPLRGHGEPPYHQGAEVCLGDVVLARFTASEVAPAVEEGRARLLALVTEINGLAAALPEYAAWSAADRGLRQRREQAEQLRAELNDAENALRLAFGRGDDLDDLAAKKSRLADRYAGYTLLLPSLEREAAGLAHKFLDKFKAEARVVWQRVKDECEHDRREPDPDESITAACRRGVVASVALDPIFHESWLEQHARADAARLLGGTIPPLPAPEVPEPARPVYGGYPLPGATLLPPGAAGPFGNRAMGPEAPAKLAKGKGKGRKREEGDDGDD